MNKKIFIVSTITLTVLLWWCGILNKEKITSDPNTVVIKIPNELSWNSNLITENKSFTWENTTWETIDSLQNTTWQNKTEYNNEIIKDESLTEEDIELINSVINQVMKEVDWEKSQ